MRSDLLHAAGGKDIPKSTPARIAEPSTPNIRANPSKPDDARSLYRLGIDYYNRGMFDSAIASWKEAAQGLPDGDMLKTTLLDIIERAEERKALVERMAALEARLTENPSLLEESIELARIYAKDKRGEAAEELWKRISELHPSETAPYVELAELYYGKGRILWAERYLEYAKEKGSEDPRVDVLREEIADFLEKLGMAGYESLVKGSH